LDVHGQVRHWSTDSAARVVYTVDNEVDVMNMVGIEGDSRYVFWPFAPLAFYCLYTEA
jgi:hypothetical protein